MKRFLTLAILASSFLVIGCHNDGAISDMEKILKIVGDINFHGPEYCNDEGVGGCTNLGDFSIVDEEANGDDRVVLKRWIEGFDFCTPTLLDRNVDGLDLTPQELAEREIRKTFCGCVLGNYNIDEIGPDSQDVKINKPLCDCLVDLNLDEIGPDSQNVDFAKLAKELSKNFCGCVGIVGINKPNCGIPIQGHWEYIPADLSHFDFEKWVAQGKPHQRIHDLLSNSYAKYGTLQWDPAEEEFFSTIKGHPELYSESSNSLKDLELMGARVEANNAITLGEKLSAQYGLSEERGVEVAKTVSVYNKLTSKRALTPSEMDSFSNKLLGVNYQEAKEGLKSGDSDDFNALMEKAAETNGTTPEQVTAIIQDMVL